MTTDTPAMGEAVEPVQPELTDGVNDSSEVELAEESPAEAQDDSHKPPKGVQKRINELVSQRNEERQRADKALELLERMIAQQGRQEQEAPEPARDPLQKPKPEDFSSDLDYVEALADWKLEVKLAQRAQQEEASKRARTLDERESAVKAKYTDYDAAIRSFGKNAALLENPIAVDYFQNSDHGVEVAYLLGKDPALAAEVSKLPSYRLAARLAQLEDSLSAPKPQPVSNAPKPVNPIGAGVTPNANTFDVNDRTLSYAQWKAGREAQLASKR